MGTSQSKTKLLILLHEIYGINDHMNWFSKELEQAGYNVLTPNLLRREPFAYEQESEAYHYFMSEIGFEAAVDEVERLLHIHRERYEDILIIGFSIGATVAWLCSSFPEVDGIVGYYGSRIRDYLEVEPACPALLIFALQEKSVQVPVLEAELSGRPNVTVKTVDSAHGFMNPYHPSYREEEYSKCLLRTRDFLIGIEEAH
ncbi:hypothetical protein DNH61_02845 [Paenibacillus sambharensis]|uniref:Dienelactone hydrolase domain-containing protein n=1 Tax=Paenibacillus sambharensis TaxID=1803190 RepID=A0A2W1M0R7_9BACL|nr:dienelactone hydrolase family protein [Paenibacillus sambharensis]PZD97307.1 hypothetical protein DNH61_02845 [Paenibacillus sambharensis]